jgi:signal transduction histidine kinase
MQRTRLVVAGVAVLLVLVLLVLLLRPGGGGGGSAEVVLREGPAFACAHNQACTTPAVLGAQVFVDGEARTGAVGLQDLQTATATFRLQEGATLQFAAVTDAVTQITLSAGRLFVNHDAAGRDQIVDLALLDAGAMHVAAGPVDVARLLREAATPSPTHPVRVDLPAALPAAWGEARRLRQVLGELLDNARRFSPPGCPILLTARLTPDGHAVRVTVRDNGLGLPATVLPRVFDPFYRAEDGHHRRDSGAGLGLTLARGWIEAHGGTIWAENVPGGAAFHFTLPTAAAASRR